MNLRVPPHVIAYVAAAKVYALVLLYLLFLRTGLQEGRTLFLFVPRGETRAERLEEIKTDFFERLAPYDGQWYLDIAAKGYRRLGGSETLEGKLPAANHAFFPLLPWLIRGVRAIFPDMYLPVMILLVAVLGGAGGVAVWQIARRLGAPADVTVVLLLAYPAAAFHYVLYTEALFLLVSTLAMLAAMRGRVGAALVFGLLGGLSRPQGVLLALPIAAELLLPHLRSTRIDFSKLAPRLGAAVSPFSGFLVMFAVSSSSFLSIQGNWGRTYEPLGVIDALLSVIGYGGPPIDLVGLVLGIGLLPVMWKRLPLSLALYGTGTVLLPLLTGSPLSFGRFLSVSIPHFLCLALLLERRPRLRVVLVLLFIALQVLLAKGLVGWYFVG